MLTCKPGGLLWVACAWLITPGNSPTISTNIEKVDALAESAEPREVTPLPYKPSWVDRFTDWVDCLPGPYWLFYLLVAIAYSTTRTIVGWLDGVYPVGTFYLPHILDGFTGIYFLFVLHYLDNRAGAALAAFRPMLTTSKQGYNDLRYRLTTMPALAVLIATIIGVAYGQVFNILISTPDPGQPVIVQYPATTVMEAISGGLSWMTNVIFAVHAFRQLRLISRIYTDHTNVNIFETAPLYALPNYRSNQYFCDLPYLNIPHILCRSRLQ